MNNFSTPSAVFERIEPMKVHTLKLMALILVFGGASARSQTLDWGSLTQSTIMDSQGAPLDNTFLFQLGTFDVDFTPTQTNLGQWSANWHTFATAAYSYDPDNLGYFTGTENVQDVSDYANMFQGLQAYLWIHNAADTEYLLATTSSDKWKFPALDPDCCPTGEVTQWSVSDLGTDTPVWGSQLDYHGGGDYAGSILPYPYDLQTSAVPEPASSLLALLGGGLVMTRRRRLAV